MKKNKSESLFQEALNYFPGGVNSPVRAFKSVGGTPLFFDKGKGSHVWDADNNQYIDYCCSWGPLILGHANDEVVNTISSVAAMGTSFGAPSKHENELAKLILENHRYIEKIRFVSSGTEAVMSAIRLARGVTGRDKIIKFDGCYHGHFDGLLVQAGSGLATFGTSSSAGVPEAYAKETIVVSLNNEEEVKKAFELYKNQIATVIIEPIPANNGLLLQDKQFLTFLRDICTKENSMLIFDEVISGFRVGFEGAAGFYDIQPDIITFGKIIGGGMPVGAYGASKKIMSNIAPEGSVYQAGTLSGNPVAMAAGKAQLSMCLENHFYEKLAQKTNQLVDGIMQHTISKKYRFNIQHIGSIFWIAFSENKQIRKANEIDPKSMNYFKTLHHELLERGVYLGPSGYEVGFVSAAHTDEDIQRTVTAFCESLDVVFS
jgi:glutamate-1-semialdehyde 2,1-aminomutase